MTESVEWERLADHEEAPRSAASAVAPMTDERLAELRAMTDPHGPYVEIPADNFETAYAIRDALAEIDRLRQQLQSATVLPERWRELMAERDAARRELAEVREQHQPGPSLHAWLRPDGRCVHGEQEWIRKSVKAHGGEHVTAETCSYVSEWKAAGDA